MITKTYEKPEVEIYKFAAEAGFFGSTESTDQTSGFGFKNETDDDLNSWE